MNRYRDHHDRTGNPSENHVGLTTSAQRCGSPRHPASLPALLISIRSIEEWNQLDSINFGEVHDDADQSFVDIIDLKEPKRGPLAAPDLPFVDAVAQRIKLHANRWLSVALGESNSALGVAKALPDGVQFAKMGSSNISSAETLLRCWRDLSAVLPPDTELVAVAYADHHLAGCLPAEEILKAALDFGLRRILIDTFTKDGRSSLDFLSATSIKRFAATADDRIWWALAGSLDQRSLQELQRLAIKPDCLGVRGQVCKQGRQSNLSIKRCREWRDRVEEVFGKEMLGEEQLGGEMFGEELTRTNPSPSS